MTTKITVGQFTRVHGTPIAYDIETQDGAQRFISRCLMDCGTVDVERYVAHIDALPAYVQSRHWVKFTRDMLARELTLRAANI
jgi:hypothetical protein